MNILFPGQVIGVRVGPLIHLGIVSDQCDANGSPMIFSNSLRSGCVALEALAVFKGVHQFSFFAQPANVPAWYVLSRARQMLGLRWNLFTRNCEHFVFSAYGLEPQSPQLRGAGAMIGLVLLLTQILKA